MKCLESDASRRYVNARELADDLQRYLDGEAIQAKPLGLSRRLHRWARHRPGLAVTWCALAMFYAYHVSCRLFGWYFDPKERPELTSFMPMFLSLLLIGIVQYFSLRKSAASYE